MRPTRRRPKRAFRYWVTFARPRKGENEAVQELPSAPAYHIQMRFGGTVLYVDEVRPVVDFYRRAFGLELRFFDETWGFAELETGGSLLAIATHALGEMLMPDGYLRPA